jgi:hypothetical protein
MVVGLLCFTTHLLTTHKQVVSRWVVKIAITYVQSIYLCRKTYFLTYLFIYIYELLLLITECDQGEIKYLLS